MTMVSYSFGNWEPKELYLHHFSFILHAVAGGGAGSTVAHPWRMPVTHSKEAPWVESFNHQTEQCLAWSNRTWKSPVY